MILLIGAAIYGGLGLAVAVLAFLTPDFLTTTDPDGRPIEASWPVGVIVAALWPLFMVAWSINTSRRP